MGGARGADIRPNGNRLDVSLELRDAIGPDGLANGWVDSPEGISIHRLRREDPSLYALCTDDPSQGYAPAVTE